MISDQGGLFSRDHSPGQAIKDDPLGALTLFMAPGVGSVYFRALLKALGSPAEVLKASDKALCSVPGIGPQTAEAIRNTSTDGSAEELLGKVEECNARIVSLWDEDYPRQLKEIHDPPALLFVRGELPSQGEICVAVVGTRDPSLYGVRQGHRIAEDLARQGIGIISGMARGVDSAAHEGCLQAKGRTYAVFGCGIDVIYPSENKTLAEKIEASGGLISEFLPGTRPDPGLFPRRNRVISGLSVGVLVVQGTEKSGALITARSALEQNREVFALPGNVEEARSRGAHHLIRQGAALITSAEDILAEIGVQLRSRTSLERAESLPALNPSEEAVVKKLSADPIHIDNLVRELERPVPSVLADLLSLEMKGWVVQLPGKLFALKQG